MKEKINTCSLTKNIFIKAVSEYKNLPIYKQTNITTNLTIYVTIYTNTLMNTQKPNTQKKMKKHDFLKIKQPILKTTNFERDTNQIKY
jgi:hypothetical protein